MDLGGVPNLGTDELKDARDRAITLELTNRFANVKGEDGLSCRLDYLLTSSRPACRRESTLGTGKTWGTGDIKSSARKGSR